MRLPPRPGRSWRPQDQYFQLYRATLAVARAALPVINVSGRRVRAGRVPPPGTAFSSRGSPSCAGRSHHTPCDVSPAHSACDRREASGAATVPRAVDVTLAWQPRGAGAKPRAIAPDPPPATCCALAREAFGSPLPTFSTQAVPDLRPRRPPRVPPHASPGLGPREQKRSGAPARRRGGQQSGRLK